LAEAERALIIRALEQSGWHKGRVCTVLGISRPTLERKLQKYAIQARGKSEVRSPSGKQLN
jgi:two-component system response regulator AtoC